MLILGLAVWVIWAWTEGSGLVGMIHMILPESAEVSVLTESSASDVVASLLAQEKEGVLNSPAPFSPAAW